MPASVPVVEQPPPVCTHMFDHTVVVPHPVPDGLKVQPWLDVIAAPTTHWPAALQVRGVVVTTCVPAVAQPPPDWVQAPVDELVPQSRPLGS